jgi:polysaccharide biosynthesis protein PslG
MTAAGSGAAVADIPENPYGVNVFLHKEVETWKIEETLRLVAVANIKWVKQEFPWNEIEFKKGYFEDDKWHKSSWEKFDNIVDLAGKYGLSIIGRVDHPPDWAKAAPGGDSPLKDDKDLADFTNALLDHYGTKIKYVQLWNEPNLAGEWVPGKAVDPAGYAAMLKAVYPPVKAAHPGAVILSAPMAMTLEGPERRGNMNEIDYWNKLYAAGAKGNFDIASANGYGLDQPPEAPPDPKVLNFRRAELLRAIMVKNGDSNKPIWFDEYGWNASPESLPEEEKNFWRHVPLQQQADWTVAGVRYARKNWPWAGVISIWYFRQVGDIPPNKAEYYFQMVDPEFVPQPVYNAVKVDATTRYPGPADSPLPTVANRPPTATTVASQPSPTGLPVATPQESAVATTQATSQPSATAAQAATTPTEAPAQPTPTAVPPPAASTNNGTMIMYVLGGLLVVGGLAGLGYYFMRSKGTPG